MLSAILSKESCAKCKFCCSFRRKSLWETPVFDSATVERLKNLYPDVKFRQVGKSSFTYDISGNYKTQDSEEEALCPFLDPSKGCKLPAELKPFDCSIWPLRAVKMPDGKIKTALTPTCPAINKLPKEDVSAFVKKELDKRIIDYAEKNPDIIKDYSDFFVVL